MTTIVRMYETEESARAAVDSLAAAGFLEDEVLLLHPVDTADRTVVDAAIQHGFLRAGSLTEVCWAGLQNGRSIVSVKAQFGRGQSAVTALQAFGPVDTELIPQYVSDHAAPLSELLGLPVLIDSQSDSVLVSSDFTLSDLFGVKLLSRSPTPLSSLLRIGTISRSRGPQKRSFGLPLVWKNPTPLSSMLRMRTLSRSRGPWRRSFGLPLLSANPAPLSSFLGIRPLTRRKRG